MSCTRIVDDFVQGDTPSWSVTVYTDEDKTTLQDTEGWQAWCTLKSDKDLTDANAELQVTGIMTSAMGDVGSVALRATITQSEALEAGTYYYDFQIKTDTDIIDTVESGIVKVSKAITISNQEVKYV